MGFPGRFNHQVNTRHRTPSISRAKTAKKGHLWMDEILHHCETIINHGFVGIYMGIMIPGFLRWCRISSIHSMNQGFRSPRAVPSSPRWLGLKSGHPRPSATAASSSHEELWRFGTATSAPLSQATYETEGGWGGGVGGRVLALFSFSLGGWVGVGRQILSCLREGRGMDTEKMRTTRAFGRCWYVSNINRKWMLLHRKNMPKTKQIVVSQKKALQRAEALTDPIHSQKLKEVDP